VLVVEDDVELAAKVARTLEAAGFVLEVAHDGDRADFLGRTESYDAVVLDLGLPRRDGLAVLRGWRDDGISVPVLVLTARNRWSEKQAGFHAGADDYLTKPFGPASGAAGAGADPPQPRPRIAVCCRPLRLDARTGT
jgi:two-component system OmpR family response regulator